VKYTRLYSDDAGESHFEDCDLPMHERDRVWGSISDVVEAKVFNLRANSEAYDLEWHTAPQRQFIFNLCGTVQIETSDGEVRRFGPGSILLAEDDAVFAGSLRELLALQGHDVRYVEADTEFARFALCNPQEQAALMRAYVEPDVLVLDDLFLARRISDASAELLQTIVHQRYKRRGSIVVTSNRIVQDWGKYLRDATMGSTILDRLMHRCVMLEFEGKSYRLKEAAARIALNAEASA